MTGRVALVTAGAQGLGGALVEHLLERGWRVVAHWRNRRGGLDDLEARFAGKLTCVQGDLASEEDREALVSAADALGRLDLLVNNLGVYPELFLEDIDLELWRSTIELTLTANFHLTQLTTELLVRSGGRVINIGDSGADRIEARHQATPYHIAKMGVHILTRTYAQRLTARGVTVNMVSPGFLENSVGEPGERIPAGRPGAFSDMAAAIDWLISDAARYVSGTNILVNGGWNLG